MISGSQRLQHFLTDDVCGFLPEYELIERLARESDGWLNPQILSTVEHKGLTFPIVGMSFGSDKPKMPAITFVGGIHGVERIGSQILLSYLHTLVHRARWDSAFKRILKKMRFNFLPLMNPVGIYEGTRCNGNGVDLMRNAPIEAEEKPSWMVGGQSFSKRLPWYRGDGTLEPENQVLVDYLKLECLDRPFNLVLDCHSGFGMRDRLWIPYAYRKTPPRKVWGYYALHQLFEKTYPHHNYIFEPQSLQYTTHGDLWDYVGKIVKQDYGNPFFSLTLEMGSWNWVRKRPIQLLSFKGLFNPHAEHRWTRVQRSHLVLFDFLKQAVVDHRNWLPAKEHRAKLRKEAIDYWYR